MTPHRDGPVVVVGDALLDRDLDGHVERLSPDAPVPVVDDPVERPRPGGAALAATLAAGEGRPVVLVTALAGDDAGILLARLLEWAGVDVVDLGLDGGTPEKVRVRAAGRSIVRIDRNGRRNRRIGPLTERAAAALAGAAGVLVADYGRGVAGHDGVREALRALPRRTPVVWDPHLRGAVPVPGLRLVTPNRAEATAFAPAVDGSGLAAVTARARALVEQWRAAGVAVTMGDQGALLAEGDGPPLVVPATHVSSGDPCGAGDRFATAATVALADGALPSEAVAAAVAAASSFVAAGGAASVAVPDHDGRGAAPVAVPGQDARRAAPFDLRDHGADDRDGGGRRPGGADGFAVAERVRAACGTVVATGGCFDLLHAGHVALLASARQLGDCLVVCLNSDDSVRRLKGADRPIVPAEDRAAVLLALGSVDAVVIFDEDTPEAVLERLRPHVFAKGADYAVADLPEARVLARWGGQAVVLPYLAGRSTSRIVREASRRGSS